MLQTEESLCNFCLIQAKNIRFKVLLVLCDFPRHDVKCRTYIQALILHNIFICASNQNPLVLTIEKVISICMCNFCLIQAKNIRFKALLVFCDFPSLNVKCRRYIQALILHNIFICASNQKSTWIDHRKVISS